MEALRSRAHRWSQLSRYYVNKWRYDGSKLAERVWYGQGSGAPDTRAQVPFMITRAMRQQLEAAGFPGAEVSRLLPQAAHQLLQDKVSYFSYVQQQKEMKEVAESAKAALAKEEEEKQQLSVVVAAVETEETTTTSVAIVSAEVSTSSYQEETETSAVTVKTTSDKH